MRYFGIKSELKNQVVNKCFQMYGSAIMPMGTLSLYFTEPITALRVCNYLKGKNNNFNYHCCLLHEQEIRGKTHIKSFKAYQEFINTKSEDVIKNCIKDLTELETEMY